MIEQFEKFSGFLKQHYEAFLLVLVALVIACVGYIYYQNQHPSVAPVQTPQTLTNENTNVTEEEKPTTPLVEGDSLVAPASANYNADNPPIANATVKWQSPTKIPDLKLILGYAQDKKISAPESEVLYFSMGLRGSNQVILAQAPAVDPSREVLMFFEKTDKGYVYMAKTSENDSVYQGGDSFGYVLSAKLITGVDTKIFYSGIIGPEKTSWSNISLNRQNYFIAGTWDSYLEGHTGDNYSYKKITNLPSGELYVFLRETGDPAIGPVKFILHNFVIKLPSNLFTSYAVAYDFTSDNSVPSITWQNGSKNLDPYRIDGGAGGCGNVGAYASPISDISNEVKVAGTTSTGVTIYEFKDINNPYMQYYYKLQGGMYYDAKQEKQVPISIEEWAKHHSLITLKNGANDYVIMSNQTYGLSAECGKPVVYLYPTKTTKVSVKVGANVTKSEPTYNSGWNVTANPNGQLFTVDGHQYESLFWEGTGFGEYPSIDSGFIVKHDDVEATLTKQLTQLGLNAKEASDFKEFWLPKMPNTPYVRFTWFTNKELDRLAPLIISPRPDTVIRVFLDFQGIDSYINIPQQKLTAIPRNGFTAVEWGGLLK